MAATSGYLGGLSHAGGNRRLYGRERELRVLDTLLAALGEGHGAVALVAGPAGIGKSALITTWAAAARDRGVRVLLARGSEAETHAPFGVARQLFERAAAEHPELDGAARLGADVVMPDRLRSAPLDPFAARHGLYWLVAAFARDAPLVLLVDDVHWSDEGSQRFLDVLRVRLDGLPVLVVAATREALSGTPLQRWEHDPGVELLIVEALQNDAVGALIADRLGTAPAPLVTACHEATGGNPFLLRELLTDLERHHGGAAADAATVADVTPATVVRSTAARLDAREPQHRALAAAVSVLGDPTPLALAARVAHVHVAEAAVIADELAADGVLAPGRPLRFVHPLVLAAVREVLPPHERSDLSWRAARVLAEVPGGLESACAQLLSADPRGASWAVALLRRGATAATERGVPEVAVPYLERALQEPAEPEDEAVVMAELAAAAYVAQQSGALDAARTAVARAAQPTQRLRAAVIAGHLLTLAGDVEGAVGGVRAALDAPDLPPDLVGEAEGLALVWSVSAPTTRAAIRDILEAPLHPAVLDTLPAAVLAVLAFERGTASGTAAETIELATRAWGGGALLRDFGAGQPFVHYIAMAMVVAGAWSTADRWVDDTSMQAAREGTLAGAVAAAANRALILSGRGDALGTEANARHALDLAATGTGLEMLLPMAVAPLARARLAIGGPADAAHALETLPAHVRELDIVTQPLWLDARAWVAAADGRPHDTLNDAAACREWEQRWPAQGGGWLTYRAPEVRALLALGEAERASAVAQEAVERARSFGSARQLGLALHAAALASAGAERVDGLTRAAATLADAGAALDRVACLIDLGHVHGELGDAVAGRATLDDALLAAERSGAQFLAARARDALVGLGGRPRRAAVSGIASLTPAERRVAELAATERSNRDIAQELFVTEKTVENHLTAVYRKLEISSRAQVASAFGSR